MFGRRDAISVNEVGSGCWTVNFLKSNKELDRATNVSLKSGPASTQRGNNIHEKGSLNITRKPELNGENYN